MRLLNLFLSFLKIGLLDIGGGYAALPLIQSEIVEKHAWLTETEFADVVTISEMTPGPLAVNAATFVGIQTCGIAGAFAATLGFIIPSCIIISVLAFIYTRYGKNAYVGGVIGGIRPVVVGLIAASSISLVLLALFSHSNAPFALDEFNFVALGIFAVSLFVLRKWKVSSIYVMLGAGAVGFGIYKLLEFIH